MEEFLAAYSSILLENLFRLYNEGKISGETLKSNIELKIKFLNNYLEDVHPSCENKPFEEEIRSAESIF